LWRIAGQRVLLTQGHDGLADGFPRVGCRLAVHYVTVVLRRKTQQFNRSRSTANRVPGYSYRLKTIRRFRPTQQARSTPPAWQSAVALQRGRVRNRSLAAGFATFAITSGTTIFADFTIKPIEVSRSRDRVQ
jgi:hypothetical protein